MSGQNLVIAKQRAHLIAITHFPAHLRFWLFAIGGITLDLLLKNWAFRNLPFPGGEPRVIIPYALELQAVLNPGALFGIGKGMTPVFLIASLLALALVIWMFVQSDAKRWVFQIALGAIFAGAVGNMYDRVNIVLVRDTIGTVPMRYWYVEDGDEAGVKVLTAFPNTEKPSIQRVVPESQFSRYTKPAGHVRDFIKIPTTFYGRELWPWVFNIADMLLVGGVAILAIGIWREQSPEPEPAPPIANDALAVDSSTEPT
ncbi:MAG: signal peptidase II [Phycisphaerae bacterium]